MKLQGYNALQSASSTDLGFMPEFITAGDELLSAYRVYWHENTSVEISVAYFALGKLAHRYGVSFDFDALIDSLSNTITKDN